MVSDPLPIKQGVPQGSILGPLLFTIYLSDFLHLAKYCRLEFFFDDTKFYLAFSTISINVALSQISEDLHRTAAWCCLDKLLVKPDKTKFIIFGVPQLKSGVRNESVNFLCTKILQLTWCRDLGVILDLHLTFNNHINSLSSSLLSTLCQINRAKHFFNRKTLQLINQLSGIQQTLLLFKSYGLDIVAKYLQIATHPKFCSANYD